MAKYGLTLDDYNVLLDAQDGQCAICPAKPSNRVLAVDHCHETGRVRALLCGACNLGLGNFRDNPERLRRAAEYLEVHNG